MPNSTACRYYTERTLGWMLNNKIIVLLSLLSFSLFVSTLALAGQKNRLSSELEELKNAQTTVIPPAPQPDGGNGTETEGGGNETIPESEDNGNGTIPDGGDNGGNGTETNPDGDGNESIPEGEDNGNGTIPDGGGNEGGNGTIPEGDGNETKPEEDGNESVPEGEDNGNGTIPDGGGNGGGNGTSPEGDGNETNPETVPEGDGNETIPENDGNETIPEADGNKTVPEGVSGQKAGDENREADKSNSITSDTLTDPAYNINTDANVGPILKILGAIA